MTDRLTHPQEISEISKKVKLKIKFPRRRLHPTMQPCSPYILGKHLQPALPLYSSDVNKISKFQNINFYTLFLPQNIAPVTRRVVTQSENTSTHYFETTLPLVEILRTGQGSFPKSYFLTRRREILPVLPSPCCVPTVMEPLTILYYHTGFEYPTTTTTKSHRLHAFKVTSDYY